MPPTYKTLHPYQKDALHLPVHNLEAALPFYETIMGFQVIARSDAPCKSALLTRDDIRIGLAENGGDPAQDGCFFGVDDVEATLAELVARGLEKTRASEFRMDQYGDTRYKVFFVTAPDGLCYCLGERQP